MPAMDSIYWEVLENLPGMIGYWDKDLLCRFANRDYKEWFGRSSEEMQGISMRALLGEKLFRLNEPFIAAALKGEIQKFERAIPRPDGTTGYTWAQYIPIREDKEVKGFIAMVSDIGRLKEAEFALARERDFFQSTLDAIQSCICVLDQSGTIIMVNRVWNEFAIQNGGNAKDQGVGVNYLGVCDAAAKSGVSEATSVANGISSILSGELKQYQQEYACHTPRERRWFKVHISGIQADLGIQAVIYHDNITELKLANENLKTIGGMMKEEIEAGIRKVREKDYQLLLQAKNASMGEMIGSIAHQWRQPLNALGVMIQSLKYAHGKVPIDKAFIGDFETRAVQMIQHLSGTIDTFRDFYRPDKQKSSFSVEEIVRKIFLIAEAGLQESRAILSLEVKADRVVSGYPNEYGQVLLTLLNNAQDIFNERQIPSPEVKVVISSREGLSCVSVSDNGGGIKEADLAKIGTPFFSTRTKGTGLGLSLAIAIMEKNLGGRLEFRNIPGGAEFSIIL
ncbi:MAG: PAS domain S-box protein [Spirochaetia bacterium]|nr:PAS domain S-box protein [Spirochaetia bacterium]